MSHIPTRNDFRKVVVVLAGSRTGSSFLFRALTSFGRFIAPTGEESPLYRQAGVGNFNGLDYTDSVLEAPSDKILDHIGQLLIDDIGIRRSTCENIEQLANDYLMRLSIQWPGAISSDEKGLLLEEATHYLQSVSQSAADWSKVYRNWVQALFEKGYPTDPALFSPSQEHGLLPQGFEEPPFVAPEPKDTVTKEHLQELPLILKTSTNIYRIPFLKALFPNARFKWIVLQRNPAATISALMDGWLSSGFHSHDVSNVCKLSIQGYSDIKKHGDRSWKFDMPRGWQDFVNRPLQDVCAFQWQQSHQAMHEFMNQSGEDFRSLHYEDLINPESTKEIISSLVNFSEAVFRELPHTNLDEPVAAVHTPKPGKWKKREKMIRDTFSGFAKGELVQLAENLKYHAQEIESWP